MDMQHPGEADTAANPVARARALIPLLQQAAPRIDAARELPPDVLDAMFAAGMFRLLVPRSCGGAELEPATYVQCVEAIAMGDASAAWCMNQGSVSMMSAAYMGLDAAREAFGGERDVLAWGYGPNGRAVRVEGGWRVTGKWSFASGSRHSTWLGAHCLCVEADGTPIQGPAGKAWERTALFRREQAKIDDIWFVLGLRGTGSDTYSVTDLFVDDAHVFTRDYAGERREPGTLYRFHMMQMYAAGFACVALGIARQTLDTFIVMAGTKAPAQSQTLLRDNNTIQHIIGHSDARLKAARAWLLRLLEETYAEVGRTGELNVDQRISIRQATTYAIHEARDVVTTIYHEAGSTAIFDNQPFERRLRDVNSVSQQLQGRRAHFETVGQHMLGLETSLRNV
ncbi:MAG TPA: acyl-CoA dehydrogenase family protein [Acetobacteraceae bacterium]|jgi:alkylation response protein AidB-like acyl-CoA dehydrogenase|nr:acyl-CoA dehydrogenase family protein [Acetobacteraceae bacterium]